ncbi:MAG: M55 family metallopeptidase [Alphaproteobacteria bacterium]
MKVYISADIEGASGITHWDEATKEKPGYDEYREQMTAEAVAACEGALAAGASEITVKDAHGSGRNILPERLPEEARLIRGWSGHPLCMVQDIDASYDALAMVGYHSAASAGNNPLAHTITGKLAKLLINGEVTSEFLLHRNAAAGFGVATVFLSGDQGICDTAKGTNPHIHTVATKTSDGHSTNSIHPAKAVRQIHDGMVSALGDGKSLEKPGLAEHFEMEIWYKENTDAYAASHYPGAKLHAPHCVAFETGDFFEIMRMLQFVL